jgi:hydrogenase maturation protease
LATLACPESVEGMSQSGPPRTLVLGLGNPVLGDDGVGCRVAEQLQGTFAPGEAEVDTCEKGGLSLMERMLGYERVILIDALTTGERPRGEVTVGRLEALPRPGAGHLNSAHETSLRTALDMARQLGADVPPVVWVVAIETERVYELSEELTPEVQAALPRAAAAVRELVANDEDAA